jgi:hypothetical protein
MMMTRRDTYPLSPISWAHDQMSRTFLGAYAPGFMLSPAPQALQRKAGAIKKVEIHLAPSLSASDQRTVRFAELRAIMGIE